MAWVAVDKFGSENIFKGKPRRYFEQWSEHRYASLHADSWYDSAISLPKGSIEKLIGRKLSWEDEPVELKEE